MSSTTGLPTGLAGDVHWVTESPVTQEFARRVEAEIGEGQLWLILAASPSEALLASIATPRTRSQILASLRSDTVEPSPWLKEKGIR